MPLDATSGKPKPKTAPKPKPKTKTTPAPAPKPKPKTTPAPKRTRAARPPRRAPVETAEDAAAWTYHVASADWRAAELRRIQAHTAMVKLGMIPDHTKDPLPAGTCQVLYAGSRVTISVQVFAPIAGVDLELLEATLLRQKVPQATLRRCWKAARTEAKPAHKFTSAALCFNPRTHARCDK